MANSEINYLIIALVSVTCVILIVLFACALKNCIKKCHNRRKFEINFDTNYSTQQLIPPIFYTDEIKDPLLQDDLIDKIPKEK